MAMTKFVVRLNIPTVMWALVEVEAPNRKEAERLALAENEKGNVSYESAGLDTSDAEVTAVEAA